MIITLTFVNNDIVRIGNNIKGFKTLLNQLLKDNEITDTLKNITKPAFAKLEKFTADKIEAKIKLDNLESSIQGNALYDLIFK